MVLIIEFILKFVPAVFLLNMRSTNNTTDCSKINIFPTSQSIESRNFSTFTATLEVNIRKSYSSGSENVQVLIELRTQYGLDIVQGVIIVHYKKSKFI